MELNFEYILEQIEFSQFQQHSTLPKSAEEILVRLKIWNRKTFPFFISWTHLVDVSKLRKLQKFEHSEKEIIFLSWEQADWRQHWNMPQSADKHLAHFQLQSFQWDYEQFSMVPDSVWLRNRSTFSYQTIYISSKMMHAPLTPACSSVGLNSIGVSFKSSERQFFSSFSSLDVR